MLRFKKYHGLGNDYIVMEPGEFTDSPCSEQVQRICHRNLGVGSDGILLGPLPSESCDYRLRIFNPDGSEAEKSGNGLRIFARALWDAGRVGEQPFTIETRGGNVTCRVHPGAEIITVEMGGVSFRSTEIPVSGPDRDVIGETLSIGDESLSISAATVGNPHCVVLTENPTAEEAMRLGPQIATHPSFPNQINVQFMKVLARDAVQIEIWERGAGYTLASGSSSTAAAAVARKMGNCDDNITVHMPGGKLQLSFDEAFRATMTGPVTPVCEGIIADDMFGD